MAAETVAPAVVAAIPAAVAAGTVPVADVASRAIAAAILAVVKRVAWRQASLAQLLRSPCGSIATDSEHWLDSSNAVAVMAVAVVVIMLA